MLRRGGVDRNVKVRDDRLDVKKLIGHHDDLQQWKPAGELHFPIRSELICSEVWPGLVIDVANTSLSRDSFLAVIEAHDELWIANVSKRRYRFDIEGCLTEIDDVDIEDKTVKSICIESEDPHAVLRIRQKVGIDDRENVCYPLAISRLARMQATTNGIPDA